MIQTTIAPRKLLKRFIYTFNVLWTIFFIAAYFWGVRIENADAEKLARKEAEASFNKDLVYRRWAAGHGGIYVPVTETTPPNPFLSHIKERDITTPSGKNLTLLNPAYMTRQVYELAAKQYGVLGHITSLNPLRPENSPDPWEKETLMEFAKGKEEITEIAQIDGKPYLRYMKRLIAEDRCLKCHAAQGYQKGDVRGGISTSVPMSEYYQITSAHITKNAILLFAIWGCGIILFNFGSSVLFRQLMLKEKTEKKMSDIIQNSPISMVEIESSTGNILSYNKKFISTFGYSTGDISTAEEWWNTIYPDSEYRMLVKDEWEKATAKAHSTGIEIETQIWEMTCKDGTKKIVEFNLMPLGEISIAVLNDISKREKALSDKAKLEERLNQAQKMEAIGTLAGGIAHDFNNILGIILGYSEMAQEDAPPGTAFSEDLNKIIIAGNRAKDLVKQILTFSRQSQAERLPLQLQSLIKEAIKMLRASIPTTIEIQDKIDSECGIVLADPTQVNQILMNLCTNANHAMEKMGGILKIQLKKIVFNSDNIPLGLELPPGEYVELTVSDTGLGIGPEVMGKIFDPYFTTKELGKGTGMGLAIVHGIITSYGGGITVESEIGKGTKFHVYFPEVKLQELPVGQQDADIPQGHEHVLLVDDEDLMAEMGKNMLERLGYRVTICLDSLEALSVFQKNPDAFDVVITDQTMPGMTGFDLARRMLQIRPGMPIILCTGYSSIVDEHAAKAQGIKEFVLKPLTKASIAKLLRNALNGQ